MINPKYDQTIGIKIVFIDTSNDSGACLLVDVYKPPTFDDSPLESS